MARTGIGGVGAVVVEPGSSSAPLPRRRCRRAPRRRRRSRLHHHRPRRRRSGPGHRRLGDGRRGPRSGRRGSGRRATSTPTSAASSATACKWPGPTTTAGASGARSSCTSATMAPSIRPTSTPSSARLAGVPNILLVNVRVPREWEAEVNSELNAAVAATPGVKLVDCSAIARRTGDCSRATTPTSRRRAWRPSPTSFSGRSRRHLRPPPPRRPVPSPPITTVSGPSSTG